MKWARKAWVRVTEKETEFLVFFFKYGGQCVRVKIKWLLLRPDFEKGGLPPDNAVLPLPMEP